MTSLKNAIPKELEQVKLKPIDLLLIHSPYVKNITKQGRREIRWEYLKNAAEVCGLRYCQANWSFQTIVSTILKSCLPEKISR